jgi:hypothetical protein
LHGGKEVALVRPLYYLTTNQNQDLKDYPDYRDIWITNHSILTSNPGNPATPLNPGSDSWFKP